MYPRRISTATIAALVTIGAVIAPATAAVAAPATAPPVASVSTSAPATAPMSVGDPSLSPTPYQGWNTYYGLGGDFSADEVLDVAEFLVGSARAEAG